jgi:hypothetical protein
MNEATKLPAEWCKDNNIQMMDPDGWRNAGKAWDEAITEREFEQLLTGCTYAQGSQR